MCFLDQTESKQKILIVQFGIIAVTGSLLVLSAIPAYILAAEASSEVVIEGSTVISLSKTVIQQALKLFGETLYVTGSFAEKTSFDITVQEYRFFRTTRFRDIKNKNILLENGLQVFFQLNNAADFLLAPETGKKVILNLVYIDNTDNFKIRSILSYAENKVSAFGIGKGRHGLKGTVRDGPFRFFEFNILPFVPVEQLHNLVRVHPLYLLNDSNTFFSSP